MSDTVAKRRPMIDLEQFERRLRQPNAANRKEDDPLAELARLGGGPEDPYKSMFEAQDFRRAAPLDEPQDRFAGQGRFDDHDDDWRESGRRYGESDESLGAGRYGQMGVGAISERDPSNPHESADSHEFAVADDQSESWRYADEALAPPDYEPEPRSRRPLYIMAAIIVAGITGIGASFALKGGSESHEVAMIRAADGPTKVQPEGGDRIDSPNQTASILNRTPQSAPVAIADGAEQPVDLSRMPDHARGVAPGSSVASIVVPRSPGQGSAVSAAAAAPPSIAGLIEPKKVKTVSVRPDGTVLANDNAPSPPSAAQVQSHAAPPPAQKAATPKSTARVATTPKPIVAAGGTDVTRSIAPKPAQVADAQAAEPVAASPAGGGAYAVQLAAPQSEQEARDIQMRLIKKYGAEIPGFHPSIRKAVSNDKTVYRVRSVGLSKDDATALCQKVQSSGGNCFVARN